jgi:Cd2+/Zn2+-exporting ATPase
VLAGYLVVDSPLIIRVQRSAGESSASRIIEMVENATHAKARRERFITRFARVYTPIVVGIAVLIAVLPPLLSVEATFSDWLYRALTILVISCPCALVVSIPLGYFGGVGGASRRGILVKGATFLDVLAKLRTVVFDKTGTLTEGVFCVTQVCPQPGVEVDELLRSAALAELHSNHPIAESIRRAAPEPVDGSGISDYEEIRGCGVRAVVNGRRVVAGNDRLLHREEVPHPVCRVSGTVVHVASGGFYLGHLIIGDRLKEGAAESVAELKKLGVSRIALLTGDNREVAASIAGELGIQEAHGELLPQDKLQHLERILDEAQRGSATAFVGDGINDAPVLARADAGIAMGQFGSDATVEVADVVLMTDDPRKLPEAIRRGRKTRRIVLQNIVFALGIKLAFVALGGAGLATMWEAVIADMGVALLAVLNATRALR